MKEKTRELQLLLDALRKEIVGQGRESAGAIFFVVCNPEEKNEVLKWLGTELTRRRATVIKIHVGEEYSSQDMIQTIQTARAGSVLLVTLTPSAVPAFARRVRDKLWIAKSEVIIVFLLDNGSLTSFATLAPELYDSRSAAFIIGDQQE